MPAMKRYGPRPGAWNDRQVARLVRDESQCCTQGDFMPPPSIFRAELLRPGGTLVPCYGSGWTKRQGPIRGMIMRSSFKNHILSNKSMGHPAMSLLQLPLKMRPTIDFPGLSVRNSTPPAESSNIRAIAAVLARSWEERTSQAQVGRPGMYCLTSDLQPMPGVLQIAAHVPAHGQYSWRPISI